MCVSLLDLSDATYEIECCNKFTPLGMALGHRKLRSDSWGRDNNTRF